MRKITLIAGLLFLAAFSLNAQQMSIENVYKPFRTTQGTIKEGTEVKGYYFFYASDKIDKKNYEWTLQIFDNNLKSLKTIKFQDSKDVTILESSFNGTDLIFLFYNEDAMTMEYQVYGADGKKKYSYTRSLTKKDKRYLELTYLAMDDEEGNYRGLYPVEGKGFISNMPSREGKDYTFQVDYFSTEKKKQWTYTPTMGGKRFLGDYLGTHNGVVYIEMLKFGSMMDQKAESSILGLSLENGKLLFERSTDEAKFKFYPATMAIMNDGKSYLYGEYFNPNDNIMKDKSLGFAFWGIDEKGAITSEKYLAWNLEVGKHLNVSSKGKIDDFGFMYLHNMVQTADGSIYAVGEGFKKVASALGIIGKVASGGRGGVSMAKIKVTDMILIKFDKDFNVKEAKIYEKNSNSVELPNGYEFVSTPLLGKMLKYSYGGFDYAYTQWNKDLSSFTVCYSDFVRGKDYKGSTFNAITYNEGKISTDKIQTKSDASRSYVMPGKQGTVVLFDIYKKEKRLEAHIEKLN